MRSRVTLIGQPTSAGIGSPMIDLQMILFTRSSIRAGLSSAFSAPSSAPTATAPTTRCGLTTKLNQSFLIYDKLRYRLMPYIYSLAWQVTNQDYTIQRPLVMDWRSDPKTWNIGDQFMFGPAILVNPVLNQDATHRTVYLPESPLWYDFWTGASTERGPRN